MDYYYNPVPLSVRGGEDVEIESEHITKASKRLWLQHGGKKEKKQRLCKLKSLCVHLSFGCQDDCLCNSDA